jgi:hypothetical protein
LRESPVLVCVALAAGGQPVMTCGGAAVGHGRRLTCGRRTCRRLRPLARHSQHLRHKQRLLCGQGSLAVCPVGV